MCCYLDVMKITHEMKSLLVLKTVYNIFMLKNYKFYYEQ